MVRNGNIRRVVVVVASVSVRTDITFEVQTVVRDALGRAVFTPRAADAATRVGKGGAVAVVVVGWDAFVPRGAGEVVLRSVITSEVGDKGEIRDRAVRPEGRAVVEGAYCAGE